MGASSPVRLCLAVVAALLLSACASQTPTPDVEPETEGAVAPEVASAFAEAVALKRAGETVAAETEFLKLNGAHPDLPGPLANLGIIALERDENEQAEAYFQKAVAADPAHLHSLNYLGVLARQRGDFQAAEGYYRAALAVDPDFQPAVRNLAILLDLYRGEFDEALALYRHYQALQPEPDPKLKDWIFDLENRMN
ncbi:hypothetical protein RE428_14470 [Marinobacter nanhaiticus D15-8W]|nr:hypothetical protein RE428_14470 [Marinobacter nanhaiticus D15-8W]